MAAGVDLKIVIGNGEGTGRQGGLGGGYGPVGRVLQTTTNAAGPPLH